MRILLVEDDLALAEALARVLRKAGFAVDHVAQGEDALDFVDLHAVDAAVVDLGLPGIDGLEVIRAWRAAGRRTPALVMTARDRFADMIAGFRAGADDFLRKPVQNEELIVRLWALIRRAGGSAPSEIVCGDLALDAATGLLTLAGLPLRTTAFEGRILRYMLHRQGAVVSRTDLAEHVYDGESDVDFNSIEVIVSRLRRKIAPVRIETVRGEGYRLDPGDGPGDAR